MHGGLHIMPQVQKSPIAVISLRSAGARRVHFSKSAADTALAWSFFDAHTAIAAPLEYDAAGARRVHGRGLTPGELGVYASHAAVWRQLLDSNERQMMVFEDDVVADWPLIERLASYDFSAIGVDYLRLFTKIPPRFRKMKSPFLDRYHHLIRITGFALGTQAYMITRSGAERLVKHASRIECPVDAYMDKYWTHGVPNLALYPFPVFERFDASSIGEARFEKQPMPVADRVALFRRRLQERVAMVRNAMGFDPDGIERELLRKLP
jgi:glycosyl transferase family 25